MFRPENIYFVQGHGDTITKENIKNTEFGPLHIEYDRFDVPENVFTVSSREIGLNTPPDNEALLNLITESTRLPIPNTEGTHQEYTRDLRNLGKKLFTTMVEDAPLSREMWITLEEGYGKYIPHILHTHGPKQEGYSALTKKEQQRDYFLFSAPNDSLHLGTRANRISFMDITGELTKKIFVRRSTFFPSGIIPLDELATRDPNTLFQFEVLLPKTIIDTPMNTWKEKVQALSEEEKQDMYDILSSYRILEQYREFNNLASSSPGDLLNSYVDFVLNLLKSCYYWGPSYKTEEEFYAKYPSSLEFNSTSQKVIENILKWRRDTGKPNEPILVLFYHCRTLGDRGDVYGAPFKLRPSIARSLSTSAATGQNANLPSNAYHRYKKYEQNVISKFKDIGNKYGKINTLRVKILRTKDPELKKQLENERKNLTTKKKKETFTLNPYVEQLHAMFDDLSNTNKQYARAPYLKLTMGGKRKTRKARKQTLRKHKTRRT